MEELFLQTVCPLLDRVELGERHRGPWQGLDGAAPLFHPVGDLVILARNGIEQQLVQFFDVRVGTSARALSVDPHQYALVARVDDRLLGLERP